MPQAKEHVLSVLSLILNLSFIHSRANGKTKEYLVLAACAEIGVVTGCCGPFVLLFDVLDRLLLLPLFAVAAAAVLPDCVAVAVDPPGWCLAWSAIGKSTRDLAHARGE